MTEIPMPASDPYQPSAPKRSEGSQCCKWAAIICVVLIIGMLLIALVFWGSFLSLFGGIIGGGTTYDTRSVASYNNSDVELFPTFYYDEFSVSSAETMTSTSPDIYFDISVDDTGTDAVSVTIHFAIYDMDQASFDAIPTWGGVAPYLVQSGNYTTSVSTYFNINNNADTYVWVIWFDAASKVDPWIVDIDLTLRYNW